MWCEKRSLSETDMEQSHIEMRLTEALAAITRTRNISVLYLYAEPFLASVEELEVGDIASGWLYPKKENSKCSKL